MTFVCKVLQLGDPEAVSGVRLDHRSVPLPIGIRQGFGKITECSPLP